MGLEEAQAIVGPLTPGKLIGLEVILDAQDAQRSLARVNDMNAGVIGGAKKYVGSLNERAGRLEELRDLKPGEKPRALGEPRFSTPEELRMFAMQREMLERQRTGEL